MLKDSLRDLRNYFIGGLFIVVPIGGTVYIVKGIFNLLDQRWLRESTVAKNLLAWFGISETFPRYGVSLLATIVLIIIVGFLGRLYVGRKTLSVVEMILARIPVVNWVYHLIKQMSFAFFGQGRNLFQRPVLIEYPRKGMYSLAFEVCEERGVASEAVGRNLKCVFLAKSPNPTSGFFLLVPEEDLIPIQLTVEQSLKMVISSGMINPAVEADSSVIESTQDNQRASRKLSHHVAL